MDMKKLTLDDIQKLYAENSRARVVVVKDRKRALVYSAFLFGTGDIQEARKKSTELNFSAPVSEHICFDTFGIKRLVERFEILIDKKGEC